VRALYNVCFEMTATASAGTTMVMNDRVKLRTACDHCTASKVRCDGGTPCARCLRTQTDCYYRPVKRPAPSQLRKSNDKAKTSRKELSPPTLSNYTEDGGLKMEIGLRQGASCLDEHERRTWTVFFSMYRKYSRGCSSYWFKMQLAKMDRFLQQRANHGALERLRGWMEALGIAVDELSVVCQPPPHLSNLIERIPQPTVHRSAEELRSEAHEKNIPLIYVNEQGLATVNLMFERTFGCNAEQLNTLLNNAGGGFLPFSGDVMARVLSREADLLTYIQVVALSFDALGKPEHFPANRSFPTSHVFRVVPGDAKSEMWAVVRFYLL